MHKLCKTKDVNKMMLRRTKKREKFNVMTASISGEVLYSNI